MGGAQAKTCNKRLKGQTALITGANSGIGAAVARAMAMEGAAVAVNYLADRDAARELSEEIQAGGGRALAVQADISLEQEVDEMFRHICEEWGGIDILVNNAGVQKDSPFMEMSLEDWNKVIAVNLTGGFLCARAAAREFIKNGADPGCSNAAGKIIFMSSVHEVIPWAHHCNYAASKGGCNLLMRSLAQELAPQGIRVNSIAPGAVKTDINRKAWSEPEKRKELLKLIPQGRIGRPEDVARVAVWLASDESDYVQGATVYVDGGMTLYPGFAAGG